MKGALRRRSGTFGEEARRSGAPASQHFAVLTAPAVSSPPAHPHHSWYREQLVTWCVAEQRGTLRHGHPQVMEKAAATDATTRAEAQPLPSAIKSIADLQRRYRAQYPVQALFDQAIASWGEALFATETQVSIVQHVRCKCSTLGTYVPQVCGDEVVKQFPPSVQYAQRFLKVRLRPAALSAHILCRSTIAQLRSAVRCDRETFVCVW